MEKEFLQIIEHHQGIIHKVCRMYRDIREDQEDLFQEVVLQLWKAFPKFRQDSKVTTWMYRIALNTALAMYRKKKIVIDPDEQISTNHPTSNASTPESENEERLFEAIRKLNKAERAIIALYFEDLPYREIASITGITENNVGVRISRIKEKLKIILNKETNGN